jgi:outer membrane protein assembly factor BamE (lipoprotein component of BamABCDE complex)
MRRSIVIATVLLGAATATACSFSRGNIGDEFNAEDVAAVKKGVSTRADVVSSLGAPDRIVEANGHEIFQYYRYDIKAGSLLLVVANFSRLNIKSDDLYVFFNREGIVEEVVFGKRTQGMEFRFWPFGK